MAWQSLNVQLIALGLNAAINAINQAALSLDRIPYTTHHGALVEPLITASAKGDVAVHTLEIPLEATLGDHGNQWLLIKGQAKPDYRCRGCEYLAILDTANYHFCGSECIQTKDAIKFKFRYVLEEGAEIEVSGQSTRHHEVDMIGACLR